MSPHSAIKTKGLLNAPGITPASEKFAAESLVKDADTHHCYQNELGFHNHLIHHVLAAYDLGASCGVLRKIYDAEEPALRPIFLKEEHKSIIVTNENWIQYLGQPSAYGAFVKFFTEKVASLGPSGAVERYIFTPEANENGHLMLVRLVSGALHPMIQIGYGAEFGSNHLIVTGLAQAAIHKAEPHSMFNFSEAPKRDGSAAQSITLLEVFQQVYNCSKLDPIMPYDPNALFRTRRDATLAGGRDLEIRRICSQFFFYEDANEEEINRKVEEIIWTATLLTFATGKEGKKPRHDFFLMHLLTSSLFLTPILRLLTNTNYKLNLIQGYVPNLVMYTLARGRPRINPELLMSHTATPRPPVNAADLYVVDKSARGSPLDDDDYNPWPALITAALHAPETHVIKSMRTLIFASQRYGNTPPGGAIGAFKADAASEETHNGSSKMDGTIFVRAAGMLMNYMGWVTHGQKGGDDWDRSALGWDAAWDDEK